MGQPVVLPKFEAQGDRPHWAVRAAWITGVLFAVSLAGLGGVIVHHRNLENQVRVARAEAIARVKAEADAKLAAIAAAAQAKKEAELAAKQAAQSLPATTLPSAGQSPANEIPGTPKVVKPGHARKTSVRGVKGTKPVTRTSNASSGSTGGMIDKSRPASNKPDAIDDLLRKMK